MEASSELIEFMNEDSLKKVMEMMIIFIIDKKKVRLSINFFM